MGDKVLIGMAALVTCGFSAVVGRLAAVELARLWRGLAERWRRDALDRQHVLGAVGSRAMVSSGGTVAVLGAADVAGLAVSAIVGHVVIAVVMCVAFAGVVVSWMMFSFIWLLHIAFGAMAVGFTIGVLFRLGEGLRRPHHAAPR